MGKSDAGGEPVDAAGGGVERRLAHAIAGTGSEARWRRGKVSGVAHVDVRVIADAVAHRLVEPAGLLALAGVRRYGGTGK